MARGGRRVQIVDHAHDMWLEVTVGQGSIGLALTIVALVSYAATRPDRASRFSGIVLFGIIVAGLTERVFGRPTGLYSVIAALFTGKALVGLPTVARVRRSARADRISR